MNKSTENNLRTNKSIVFGIGGKSIDYSIDSWIKLISFFDEAEWNITILGGKDTCEKGKIVEKNCMNITNLIGELNFKSTVSILKKSDYYIGNDSSLSHFASLYVPVCLIILGGGTFGRFFRWLDSKNQYVIYYGLECFDCSWTCKHDKNLCIDLIQPQDIYDYFNDIIINNNVAYYKNLNPVDVDYKIAWRLSKETNLINKFSYFK